MEDDGQVVLDGHGGLLDDLGHHALGSALAKQGTLVGEQLGEEKPPCPWEYMKEEENPQLLLFQEEN